MAGFRYIRNLFGGAPVAPPFDNFPFQMTNAEAAVAGSFGRYNANTGRLTKVVNDKLPAVLILEAKDAATPGAKVRAMWVLPGMVFEAPYTDTDGTAPDTPHANAVVGFPGIEINALGTGVDVQEAPANGKLVILEVDTTNKRAIVALSCTLLSNYVANA